jgi:hypothetical protein
MDAEGVIMGGAALTLDYDLEPSPYGLLHYETQRRTAETLRNCVRWSLSFRLQTQIRDLHKRKY